ncbi:tyrosine-type recombinase/integrase [Streptomyces sp. NPDC006923]|uniref:tyrosine-type recombinase/integrase n=1 Tax=Streptomyces sp. NPDC006923 TaxID=3155355 RepID=UPI00340BA121
MARVVCSYSSWPVLTPPHPAEGPEHRPIDPTNLTRTFLTLLRKASLRRIRFHDLRHSTATLLLEQGVDLVVIKELLGHAHIGVYAHVRLRLQHNAIDTLGTGSAAGER